MKSERNRFGHQFIASFILLLPLLAHGQASPSASCVGDCNADGQVTVQELVLGINVALGDEQLDRCPTFDTDANRAVTVDELVAGVNAALAGCRPSFHEKLQVLKWVAYAPTSFDPNLGCPAGYPGEASLGLDLKLLRARGFDGLITFASDCTLGEVPRIASETGFRGVIMGLFLFSESQRDEEIARAKAAAEYVDAYGIGNEGLIGCGGDLYLPETLTAVMEELRVATGRPVSTSEQIEDYLDGGCLDGFLLRSGDWLFPIAHPFNNGIRHPEAGAAFTEERYQQLISRTAKPVLLKETGWPTAGEPAATEVNQETYFLSLREHAVRFAYFESFDQPFKQSFPLPWEPYWGLFRQDRSTKQFIRRNEPVAELADTVGGSLPTDPAARHGPRTFGDE